MTSPSVPAFHDDGHAAEKLRGPKPTVQVLGVTKSPRSADRRWRRAENVDTGMIVDARRGTMERADAGICRPVDIPSSHLIDEIAASEDRHEDC